MPGQAGRSRRAMRNTVVVRVGLGQDNIARYHRGGQACSIEETCTHKLQPGKAGLRGPPPSSALARLITFLCPVDDVYSALAPHQLVGAVARAQGFQRVADFHRRFPKNNRPRSRLETKTRPMPYWRPAINRKNKCPERGR